MTTLVNSSNEKNKLRTKRRIREIENEKTDKSNLDISKNHSHQKEWRKS